MPHQFLNEIPSNVFTNLKQIGSGSFSSIFSATHVKTNVPIALKITLKTEDTDITDIINQEIQMHKSLNHPFICKYYTDFETEHLKVAVIELIEGINLLEHVNKRGGLRIQDAQDIFAQILIVIEYLHEEQKMTHRDLKLENIMIDNYGHIRLIDFGFCTSKLMMSTICGSIPYCAPEVLKHQNYTNNADIWCLGIILFSLVAGNLPFYDTNIRKLIDMICNQDLIYPITFDQNLRDLLSKILAKDPTQRISIESIKKHRFISHVRLLQINYKQLFSSKEEYIPPTQKNTRQIKDSHSHPNIRTPNLYSPNFDIKNNAPHNFLAENPTLKSPNSISKLHKIVNATTNNIDDLIISRKNFPSNLNKLIDEAIFLNFPTIARKNGSHVKLITAIPGHSTVQGIMPRRYSHFHFTFKQPQVITNQT